ncbi:MAG: hypothetical protein SGI92_29955 [Bryobacteraceae bacterium]|nr:hypothetical protein [Bryobacteraceae bacterium]
MMANGSSVLRVLMIEEDPADIRVMRDALAEGELPFALKVISDGVAAIDWMINECGETDWRKRRPDLILLNLELTSLSARSVLLILKAHVRTRAIPVIVMSRSCGELVIQDASDHRANCYVEKSGNRQAMLQILRGVRMFWMDAPRLSDR